MVPSVFSFTSSGFCRYLPGLAGFFAWFSCCLGVRCVLRVDFVGFLVRSSCAGSFTRSEPVGTGGRRLPGAWEEEWGRRKRFGLGFLFFLRVSR